MAAVTPLFIRPVDGPVVREYIGRVADQRDLYLLSMTPAVAPTSAQIWLYNPTSQRYIDVVCLADGRWSVSRVRNRHETTIGDRSIDHEACIVFSSWIKTRIVGVTHGDALERLRV